MKISAKLTVIGVFGHSDDAHWLLWNVSTKYFHVSAVFICSEHSSTHPVRPENIFTIHSQTERMNRLVLQNHLRMHKGKMSLTHFHLKNITFPMKNTKIDASMEELTNRRLPSYSQRSILSSVASEKYSFSARWSIARPLGVRMLLPIITRTLAPESVARMILGDCSFQLVQNIRLKERTGENQLDTDTNWPSHTSENDHFGRIFCEYIIDRTFILLTLIENEGSGVIISRHRDHRISVKSSRAALVHSVTCDGGGGVARPVKGVPTSVISQTFYWTYIYRKQ